MRTDGLATQVACRVLGVSESGFYAWRSRPPSSRSIRHAWLTDIVHHIHQQSRGTYGAPRVHAELRLAHGITVGHNAVAMLMKKGRPGRSWWEPKPETADQTRGHASRPGIGGQDC